MDTPISRSISDIKVTCCPEGTRVRIAWTDSVLEDKSAEFFGASAHTVITDLHAVTLMGESERRAYLVGFIRNHSIGQNNS